MGIISYKFFPKIKKTQEKIKEQSDAYVKTATENLSGIREIKALGIKNNIEKRIFNNIDDLFKNSRKIRIYEIIYYNLNSISAIDENLKKIRSLEKLDKEGLKENKSAIKFSDKLNSIESKLYFERAKQVESFYKQLELCKNQLISLKNRIEKESAKDDIKAITENFNYISYNALSLGTDIHIKLPKLSEIIARERNIEHRRY